MAKEMLAKIQAAEEHNRQVLVAMEEQVSALAVTASRQLQEKRLENQQLAATIIAKKSAENAQELAALTTALQAEEESYRAFLTACYEENIAETKQVILAKVREANGSK